MQKYQVKHQRNKFCFRNQKKGKKCQFKEKTMKRSIVPHQHENQYILCNMFKFSLLSINRMNRKSISYSNRINKEYLEIKT